MKLGKSCVLFLLVISSLAFPLMADAETCLDHEDCDPTYYCLEGMCYPLASGDCRKDTDCPGYPDLYCEQSSFTCRFLCATNEQCRENEFCNPVTHKCDPASGGDEDLDLELPSESDSDQVVTCSDHADCPYGFYCEDSVCQPLAAGECRRHDDCPNRPDTYCDSRLLLCRYYCMDNGQCLQGEFCDDDYTCQPIPDGDDELETFFCLYDSDCTPQVCDTINHVCIEPCLNDGDCAVDEICINRHCSPASPGDDDELPPWMDYDRNENTPSVDSPIDPGSTDGDEESFENGPGGGLIDCKPGEICTNGNNQTDGDGQDGSSGCQHGNGSGALFALLIALMYLRKRRRFQKSLHIA